MNIEFNRNEDLMKQSLTALRQKLDKIFEGGGKKAIEKQREKNKLVPRERIEYLIDRDKPFIEIGAFAGYEMYDEQGGCPAGGTVGGHWLCKRSAMCDRSQRRHSEGRSMVSHHRQKESESAGGGHGKPAPHHLPGRQRRRLPSYAG